MDTGRNSQHHRETGTLHARTLVEINQAEKQKPYTLTQVEIITAKQKQEPCTDNGRNSYNQAEKQKPFTPTLVEILTTTFLACQTVTFTIFQYLKTGFIPWSLKCSICSGFFVGSAPKPQMHIIRLRLPLPLTFASSELTSLIGRA